MHFDLVQYINKNDLFQITRVIASHEFGVFWRVLETHYLTAEIETRMRKVSRPVSSGFSW